MSRTELSIVLPAYNESEHLLNVVSEMASVFNASGISYEIRVVDNGSTDSTEEVIKKIEAENPHVSHLHLEKNRHYGGGILAGLEGAKGEVVGWADADGQVDPRTIVQLYKEMCEKGLELGKAVRVVRPEALGRRIQTKVYNILFRIFFLTSYTDMNAKPKLLTRRAVDILQLQSHDFFLDPEFVIKALRNHMPICEVPTVWRERQSGRTRIHVLAALQFLKSMVVYRLGLK